MADFVAVLRKTLDGLGETTPDMRAKVYDKARSTIQAKLAAIDPPPPAAVAERQKRALEDAISTIERDYAGNALASDPLAELENIFSSIDRNKNQPNHVRPTTRVEPAAPRPQPEPAAEPTPKMPPPTPTADAAGTPPATNGIAGSEVVDEVFEGDEEPAGEPFPDDRYTQRGRGRGGLIAAVVALLVVAGGGYGVWLNQDAFKDMLGLAGSGPVSLTPVQQKPDAKPDVAAAPTAAPAGTPAEGATDTGEGTKFTQKLLPDGKEVDPGPAGGESGIGEGTSVVALTTPPPTLPPATTDPAPPATDGAPADATATPPAADGTTPATPTPPATTAAPAEAQPALAVGQKAIFYEERTNTAEGSAEPGSTVWSLVQESPGGDAPPEPAIRAEATIPGKDVQLRMTIRRNTDQTLPASHIIELIFLTPDGFEGGGIDNILRFAMKSSEQDAGSPLIGIPAKIADGFFLVALNDTKADENANLTLLRNQNWIDIPVVYKSGRRALLTMEKGIPGEKVFDEALKAWQAKTAAQAE